MDTSSDLPAVRKRFPRLVYVFHSVCVFPQRVWVYVSATDGRFHDQCTSPRRVYYGTGETEFVAGSSKKDAAFLKAKKDRL